MDGWIQTLPSRSCYKLTLLLERQCHNCCISGKPLQRGKENVQHTARKFKKNDVFETQRISNMFVSPPRAPSDNKGSLVEPAVFSRCKFIFTPITQSTWFFSQYELVRLEFLKIKT